MQKLSIWQLIPLGVLCWIRGYDYNFRLEFYEGKWVTSAIYSPDGTRVYGGGSSKTPETATGLLCAWDTATGKRLWERAVVNDAYVRDVSPDGRQLFATVNNEHSYFEVFNDSRLFDSRTGALLHTIPNQNTLSVCEASFSPDSKNVVLVYENREHDKGKVECWNLTGNKPVREWQQATTAIGYLKPFWVPEQKALLMVSGSRRIEDAWEFGTSTVELWNTKNGVTRKRLARGAKLFASVSASQKIIAIGGRQSRYLSLYNLDTGKMQTRVKLPIATTATAIGIEAVREKNNGTLQARLTYASMSSSDSRHVTGLALNMKSGVAQVTQTGYNWEGISTSPDGRFFVKSHQGSGKLHPPLVTLLDSKTGAVVRDFQGEAGWYPKP